MGNLGGWGVGLFEYNQAVAQTVISSLSNPLVKQARALHQRRARAETGMFLVEGIHPVGEVLEAGWPVHALIYAPDLLTSDFGRSLLSLASQQGARLQPVSKKVMESLAGKDNPQGILAMVRQRNWELSELEIQASGVAVVSPQDPGNIGTILRTLDAVGGGYLILLDGGVDPYHPTSIRASMGTMFWKPVVQARFSDLTLWARHHGIQLVGSSAHARGDYRMVRLRAPWLLVLGSEQKGLSQAQLEACDETVALPMRGRASSLNLAVAAGILLYQFLADHLDGLART